MSLICGALKWLKDSNERDRVEAEKIFKGEGRFVCIIDGTATYIVALL